MQEGDLQILDLSDPMKPRRLGSYDSKTHGIIFAPGTRLVVTGKLAVLVSIASGGKLDILDVSDPRNPRLLSRYDKFYGQAITDLGVAGSRAYVATHLGGIHTIDFSDPRSPVTVSVYDRIATTFGGIAVTSSFLFAATQAAPEPGVTLLILDIRNQAEVSALSLDKTAMSTPGGVAVQGTQVFVASGSRGVHIVDVSNPLQPTHVRHLLMTGQARRVIPWGDWLVVPAGDIGIHFLDLKRGTDYALEADGEVESAAVSGPLIYFTDRKKGLSIVRLTVPK